MIESRSLTPSPIIPLSMLSRPTNALEENVSSISSMVQMESVLNNSSKLSNKLPRLFSTSYVYVSVYGFVSASNVT